MADLTPAGITPGSANDESVVHASDADLGNLSRSHTERAISRLQGAILVYSASKTYDEGDLVREAGFNWINITPIAVPEAFDSSKWAFIDNGLGIIFVSYNTDTAGDGQFFVINGGNTTGTGTEANAQAPVAGGFSLVFFTVQVQTNTRTEDAEWAFRKNSADSISVITIGGGLTGVFQDVSTTEDIILGDLICYQYRELVSGAGAVTFYGSSCATRRTEA